MARDEHDADLRRWFAALRRQVSATTPPFQLAAGREPRGRRGLRPLLAGSGLALAIAVGIWLGVKDRMGLDGKRLVDPTATTWVFPTDFLLDTPGWDLLQRVPAVALPPAVGRRPDDGDSANTRTRRRT
jgi:hypothetical protein